MKRCLASVVVGVVFAAIAGCGGGSGEATSNGGEPSATVRSTTTAEEAEESTTTEATTTQGTSPESSRATVDLRPDSEPLPDGWPTDLVLPEDCLLLGSTVEDVEAVRILGTNCVRDGVDVYRSMDDLSALLEAAGFEVIRSEIVWEDPLQGQVLALNGAVEFNADVHVGSIGLADDGPGGSVQNLPGTGEGDENDSLITLAVSFDGSR